MGRRSKIYLITGYAQSGKDTLADALIKELGGSSKAAKISFADPLKEAANTAFAELGLGHVDFKREEWKKKHRNVLVAIGEAAREEMSGVFATLAANAAIELLEEDKHVIIPDWRYVNESATFERVFKHGITQVRMWKTGSRAGNEVERLSIQGIEDNCKLDYVGVFREGDTRNIEALAKLIARETTR